MKLLLLLSLAVFMKRVHLLITDNKVKPFVVKTVLKDKQGTCNRPTPKPMLIKQGNQPEKK